VASSDPASAHPDTTTAANISVATNQRYTQLSMFVMVRVSAVFWALAEQRRNAAAHARLCSFAVTALGRPA